MGRPKRQATSVGELVLHHPQCPCEDCALDREVDRAVTAAGMVTSCVDVETGAATVEVDE